MRGIIDLLTIFSCIYCSIYFDYDAHLTRTAPALFGYLIQRRSRRLSLHVGCQICRVFLVFFQPSSSRKSIWGLVVLRNTSSHLTESLSRTMCSSDNTKRMASKLAIVYKISSLFFLNISILQHEANTLSGVSTVQGVLMSNLSLPTSPFYSTTSAFK